MPVLATGVLSPVLHKWLHPSPEPIPFWFPWCCGSSPPDKSYLKWILFSCYTLFTPLPHVSATLASLLLLEHQVLMPFALASPPSFPQISEEFTL